MLYQQVLTRPGFGSVPKAAVVHGVPFVTSFQVYVAFPRAPNSTLPAPVKLHVPPSVAQKLYPAVGAGITSVDVRLQIRFPDASKSCRVASVPRMNQPGLEPSVPVVQMEDPLWL